MTEQPVETAEEVRGSLAPGAMVGGRFRIDRLIGRGGMGEVYAARHASTGKEVALKLIRTAQEQNKDQVRRFMREARAATAIQHPNVIEVFDVFEDSDGTPVMVMELLKGEPFSRYRQRARALKLHEVAAILLPATRALQAAHAKGIVHRDLKPDNVFLCETPQGRTTKLLDFGIAKVLDPTKISSETQGQQTSTGSILGTPHYMSFEQAMSDKQVDHRTDVWAMGVMLFEALIGRRPLTYDTLGQMYASFLQGTVPSIVEFVPDLPRDVVEVLDRCLVKERDGRLSDLGPLIQVLEKYSDPRVPGAQAGGVVIEAPVKPAETGVALSTSIARAPQPRRSRAPLLVAGIAVVAVAAAGGVVAFSRRGPTTTAGGDPAAPTTTASAAASSSGPSPSAVAAAATAPAGAAATGNGASAATATTATPAASQAGSRTIARPAGAAPQGPPRAAAPASAAAAPAQSPRTGIYEKPPY